MVLHSSLNVLIMKNKTICCSQVILSAVVYLRLILIFGVILEWGNRHFIASYYSIHQTTDFVGLTYNKQKVSHKGVVYAGMVV